MYNIYLVRFKKRRTLITSTSANLGGMPVTNTRFLCKTLREKKGLQFSKEAGHKFLKMNTLT